MNIKAVISRGLKVVLWPIKVLFCLCLIGLLFYAAVQLIDYQKNAYRFASNGVCNDVTAAMRPFASRLPGSFSCLNTTSMDQRASPGQMQNVILFLANEVRPDSANSGHAWVILMKASVTTDGKYIVHEFLSTGFGPATTETKWHPALVGYYDKVRPALPVALEPGITKALQYLYLPLTSSDEGAPRIEGQEVILEEGFIESEAFIKVFGHEPAVVLAAVVSDQDYENAKKIAPEYANGDYSLMLRDCTTFVYRVASAAHLYTPPRVFAMFPSQSVGAISRMNRK